MDGGDAKICLVSERIWYSISTRYHHGGINKLVAPRVIDAGANVIVAGSAVFNGDSVENYSKNIRALRCKIKI